MSSQLTAALASPEHPPRRTPERVPSGKNFIVAVPARMLKRNRELSKNARRLWQTMQALADGRTGELRIKGRWLRAETIDAASEMCRDIRMRCMRELVAARLVTFDRERVVTKIRGRYREVRGRSRYTVHRTPVALDVETPRARGESRVLLKSISSTVEKIDSQVLSETPEGALLLQFPRVLPDTPKSASLMQFPQDQGEPNPQERITTTNPESKNAEAKATPLGGRFPNHPQRAHIEDAIYRESIFARYFDATNGGMKPDDCFREALSAGVLSLTCNRSAELNEKGIADRELESEAWQRLHSGRGLEALLGVKGFGARSRQVVAVVTRVVTDVALEFLYGAVAAPPPSSM